MNIIINNKTYILFAAKENNIIMIKAITKEGENEYEKLKN